ncbi:MAG: hypothetical protein ACI3WQ_01255, partial [Faecousia sp.]
PGKIGNANTRLHQKWWSFFLPKRCHRHLFSGKDNPLAYPGKKVIPTQDSTRNGGVFSYQKNATGIFLAARTIH